jgi:hypothetical protein
MNLRSLLEYVDSAKKAGDITRESPVFAVVRNGAVGINAKDAWHAISIVDSLADPDSGALQLIADAADDAADITVASLRSRASKLPEGGLGRPVVVSIGGRSGSSAGAQESIPVVEAYGDEHGLGLMLRFEGYDEWIRTQG